MQGQEFSPNPGYQNRKQPSLPSQTRALHFSDHHSSANFCRLHDIKWIKSDKVSGLLILVHLPYLCSVEQEEIKYAFSLKTLKIVFHAEFDGTFNSLFIDKKCKNHKIGTVQQII